MTARLFQAWIDHLTTPVPRHVRQMGYARELRDLGARRNRCRRAWQSHLEHTRAVILEAAQRRGKSRGALIVGSGLLLFVPRRGSSGGRSAR